MKKIRRFVIILLLAALLPGVLSVVLYHRHFGSRLATPDYFALDIREFTGLTRELHRFASDKGQLLTGYFYRSGGADLRGIVILAHGFGGGGHNRYMDVANYFAENGYGVFAFDATGNDESEGSGVGGLPQGVMDLSHAIRYVEESGRFPALPIVLWGHSWGAYCAACALSFHPEIRAVAMFSGINSVSDLLQAQGKEMLGGWSALFMPYIRLYETLKFGSCAGMTAADGFAASKTPVMIIQGSEDTTAPAAFGYDIWKDAYGEDDRFTFVLREGFGHNNIYYSDEAVSYIEEFNRSFDQWLKSLDYDYAAEENRERFVRDKSDYIYKNLDRQRWTRLTDKAFMKGILRFFDENIR